jgi:RNA polymerase sigma-B factor
MRRRIVQRRARAYNGRRVSAQPSASTVDEATRPTTPSPSGRLLLRMPPGLHAELARAAEREGVSLNGYITSHLGESVGWSRAERDTPQEQAAEQPRPSKSLVWALVANAVAVVLAAAAAIVILLVAILT